MKLREEVRWLGEHYQASQQRVCELMQIAVSSYLYRTTRNDAALRERLVELARKKPRWGYRRLHILLTGSGMCVNHKRVFWQRSTRLLYPIADLEWLLTRQARPSSCRPADLH